MLDESLAELLAAADEATGKPESNGKSKLVAERDFASSDIVLGPTRA